jgi:hypothetical protein
MHRRSCEYFRRKFDKELTPKLEQASSIEASESPQLNVEPLPSWARRLDSAFHWNNHGRRYLDRNTYLFLLVWSDAFYPQKEWLSVRGSHWASAEGNDEYHGVYRNVRCDWAPCGRMLKDLSDLAAHTLEHIDTKFQVPKHIRSQWCPGQVVDILDGEMIWYPARIIDASPGRFLIRYDDEQWSQPEFDEWIWRDSARLAPSGHYTAGKRRLPPGTFLPQHHGSAPREDTKASALEHHVDPRHRFRYYTGRAHRKRAPNTGLYQR